jgi:hypothetical protein
VNAGGLLLLNICGWRLERSSTGEEIEDEHNDGEDQKDVDPAAEGITANKSQDPEDEKNYRDCPKHFVLLDDCRFYLRRFAGGGAQKTGPSCGKLPSTSSRLPVRIKYESSVIHKRGT